MACDVLAVAGDKCVLVHVGPAFHPRSVAQVIGVAPIVSEEVE